MSSHDKQRPEISLRDGTVKADVWRNQGEKGDYFNTTLTNHYRDKQGNWLPTNSYSKAELAKAHNLAGQAYNGILEIEASDREKRQKQRYLNERDGENAGAHFKSAHNGHGR
ncbi:MAG: hypothetical protein AAF862_12740 [Pseudomonadota bacterium]